MNLNQEAFPFVFNKSFTRLEDFIEVVRDWDLEFLQLDKGKFEGLLFQAQIGQILLGEAYFGRSFCQKGSSPPNSRTFVIPAQDSVDFTWRKIPVSNNNISLFPENGELYSISKRGFHIFTLSIPEELIAKFESDFEISDLFHELEGEKVWIAGKSNIEVLRKELILTKNAILNGLNVNFQGIAYKIVYMLLSIIAKRNIVYTTPIPYLRRKALKKAISYIHGNDESKFQTKDLVDYCQVSERTIQYAFKQEFGVSPKEYISAVSLNKVRKNLLNTSDKNKKISEIANQFGFWHMGQFAKDYFAKFGELPSITKNNNVFFKGHGFQS